MPLYEYRCEVCDRKFSALLGVTSHADDERCPHCSSSQTRRLISRFARVRSEDQRLDEVADQLDMSGDPDSPTEMRRIARDLGKALDEDASDEMEEMFEADFEEGIGEGSSEG